ncbi:head maturation protease, ClpP-related [Butyricicoccus pullicaecorum]|uniref:ATP-dependent Clp protease proteolytic subunit n=1 Tax=Butyricicoccus pullicaecorum 1.2 TaxID=1203606 RepID=R8W0B1_9FIRM|nr:head maturation protease, ClpP-related [Butyricicoccus pullicaecorum]EOQ37951.1 ATP-dependent Clp endopeptidase, proteolytic subunit ClpP [Butyricicoccus pullicaecorum 1.2]SKA60730.1 ATP-dependent Clp endopeptidase, proteolytic subunit ClpP [Butyricicoccus pullicaecorum DSM 23266]
MKIDIKGVIVANDDKWVYDWFDMDAVAPREVLTALDRAPNERADVYINSPGGSVFAGGEIYDALRAHPGGVQIHVTGHAASAASMIMCAGPCDISPTALVMIHNVSGGAQGDYHEMDATSETLKKANQAVAAAYRHKTGKSEEELLALMDKETWMTAQEAIEAGFADSLTESARPLPLTASFSGMLPQAVIDKLRAERAKHPPMTAQDKARAELELLTLGGKTR